MAFTNQHLDFLRTLLPYALDIEKRYGIPHVATLAQAAYESGWGKRFTGQYNFFGMTAYPGYKGKTVTSWTTEEVNPHHLHRWPNRLIQKDLKLPNGNILITVQRQFQSYDSIAQAFEAYAINIKNVYPDALAKSDPLQYLNALFDDIGKYKYASTNYMNKMPNMVNTIRRGLALLGDDYKKTLT